MRTASPPGGARRPRAAPGSRTGAAALSPLTSSRRPRPASSSRAGAASRTGSSQRIRPATRRGRVSDEHRARLADLTAGLAAGAAVCSVVALIVLPSVPAGVALAAGALVSAAVGAVLGLRWSRDAVAAGGDPREARSTAVRAVVTAHAVAAVPVGLAVLLAG